MFQLKRQKIYTFNYIYIYVFPLFFSIFFPGHMFFRLSSRSFIFVPKSSVCLAPQYEYCTQMKCLRNMRAITWAVISFKVWWPFKAPWNGGKSELGTWPIPKLLSSIQKISKVQSHAFVTRPFQAKLHLCFAETCHLQHRERQTLGSENSERRPFNRCGAVKKWLCDDKPHCCLPHYQIPNVHMSCEMS